MNQIQLDSINKIVRNNGGTDPIADAVQRLSMMDKETLEKVVLLAANRIGVAMNMGQEFESPVDAANMLILGLNEIFNAYDTAMGAAFAPATPTWGMSYAKEGNS